MSSRPLAPPIEDALGRPLGDLRVSVTDRCNFRCRYCMPREKFGAEHQFLPRAELLSFEELSRLTALLSGQLRKVRLTGGEPLLRKDLPDLVRRLKREAGLPLALTTNGVLLPRFAAELADAGLDRLTVSLDALDEAVFRRVTDADYGVENVLAGLEAAERAGFSRVKINCVVRRGYNESEILPLARHFRGRGHVLRFIEYMDVGATNGWSSADVVSATSIVERIDGELPLEPVERALPTDVASRYRYRDGSGEVGVIASVSQPFCGSCSRLRLSADGKLHTCLFAATGTDVRGPLRRGATDEELFELVQRLWQQRTDRYSELRAQLIMPRRKLEMSYLGG
ncbi:MAG: 3,8-cyclase MoaA [Polyangiaceae bacterium]|jgi:cyclic pyranopterin phosphate synthase|nr:3,8-cyclase MoaA [Polyangiaceae bacterium]